MTAITQVGSVTTNSTGTGGAVTSITCPYPSGLAANDLLLWQIVGNNVTVPTGAPTGWNIWTSGSTTAVYNAIYYKFATGSESGSATSQTLPSARTATLMIAFRGADLTTPQDGNPGSTNGTTATTFPAPVLSTGGCLMVAFGAQQFASGTAAGTLSSTTLGGLGSVATTAAAAANTLAGVGFLLPVDLTAPTMANSATTARTVGITTAIRCATRTRMYVSNDTAHTPPITPTADGMWEDTSLGFARRTMRTERVDSSLGSVTYTKNPVSVPHDICHRQFISDPFTGSGTLAGTMSYVFRTAETNAAADAYVQIVARIIKPDATARGTVFAGHTAAGVSATASAPTGEIPVTAGTKLGINVALSSQAYQAGDYLVVELGVRACVTANNGCAINHGDPADNTADHPLTINTSTLVPWIEFDSVMAFTSSPKTRVSRAAMDVLIKPTDTPTRVSRVAMDVIYRKQPDHVGWGQRI